MGSAIYYRPSILKEIRAGVHAVIEASAGTGKTFAIEHLVVDVLLSGECAVDQILVVTFTEKATAELRVRIRQALEKILFGAPSPDPAGNTEPVVIDELGRKRLEDAFYSFDRAPIFTIHGFCHRVLTDFGFQSGALLDLQLTDGRGAFHQAFRQELREYLAADSVTRPLLERWLTGPDPDQPKGKSPDDLETLLFGACSRRYLDSSDFGAREKAAERLIKSFDAKVLRDMSRRSDLNAEPLGNLLHLIDDLEACVQKARQSGQKLLDLLEGVKFDALFAPDSKLKKGIKFPVKVPDLESDLRAVAIATRSEEWKLVDLFLPRIARRLERDKRERGLIDYDDMLEWVWSALEGPGGPALAAALRARFRCALVDEFQDTDDLQWQIFRRLFVNSEEGNRLYLVGDPKQAIYAFRGADVFTYLKARGELTASAKPPVQLLDNFRSTSDLIKACNYIFDQKAHDPLFEGEITYDYPVRCGRPDRRAIDNAGNAITPVILMRYQRADRAKASVSEVRAAVGRHFAEQLHRILEDAHPIKIEEKDAKPRVITAKDIFVLTRTRQESAEAGEYLREAGVPFAFYKQEGLFQTSEAYHILDVLRAVAAPHLRSHRLKAWVSPFFGVPLREVALIEEVPPTHALNERLYEWKAIAEQGQFADLFDRLLHDSGLVNRELFLSGSERQLTNYLHIFEILLAAALARRLALPDIIALLDDYINERASPEVAEGNTQRLESEREAVSVITVHMSKGLEADVVVLFGGFGRIPDHRKLVVYHDEDGQRRFAIGQAAKDSARPTFKTEEGGEDRRLLYVALTRARVRLYLPLLPENSTKQVLGGYYSALNDRLLAIEADPDHRALSKLLAVQDVAEPFETAAGSVDWSVQAKAWTPPPALMDDKDNPSAGSFWTLRRSHYPLVMRSYTSLRGSEEEQRWDIPPEEFKRDLEMPADERDLPGGREVGIFLHEVIERVAMESFAQTPALDGWRQRDDVKGLFYAAMHRNQVKNQSAWFDRGTQVVFNTLTSRIAISNDRTVGPLHQCPSVREMEFVYPIPESSHPLLAAAAAQGEWTVERGYLKGFVDFVFEYDGLVYFADWKSDQLSSYEAAEIEGHVKKHYWTQGQIYSIGIIRLLQIRNQDDYERRFGGLLYIFLRGMDGGGRRGVYFHRPAWSEICAYEAALMRIETGSAASNG
jgi:exodeoxyribonuclease V beta subunit